MVLIYTGMAGAFVTATPSTAEMTLLETKDFGKSWTVFANRPSGRSGNSCFAASGSGLHILSARKAIFITGGTAGSLPDKRSRPVLAKVSSTGLPSGPTSGAYGMAVSGKRYTWLAAIIPTKMILQVFLYSLRMEERPGKSQLFLRQAIGQNCHW